MTDYIIIGMVLHKPLTGYDIKKGVEMGVGNFVKTISHGSLYPALRKLAEKEFLTMKEEPENGRMKKYYQATVLGKAEFLKWLSSPVDIKAGSAVMLLRMYFIGELPQEIREQIIDDYEIAIQKMFDDYKKIETQFKSIKNDRDYFEMSTLYYGLQTAQGMLHWLGHIKDQKPFTEFIKEENWTKRE